MQGSARKDVVFGAARGYTFTVPGPKWKSWLKPAATARMTQRVLGKRQLTSTRPEKARRNILRFIHWALFNTRIAASRDVTTNGFAVPSSV